jgi:hypothetical protein
MTGLQIRDTAALLIAAGGSIRPGGLIFLLDVSHRHLG